MRKRSRLKRNDLSIAALSVVMVVSILGAGGPAGARLGPGQATTIEPTVPVGGPPVEEPTSIATTPLSLSPSVPTATDPPPTTAAPPTALSVTVEPATGLTPGQRVTVNVENLGPQESGYLVQCPTGASVSGEPGAGCRYLTSLRSTDKNVQVAVSRRLATTTQMVDCALSLCELRLFSGVASEATPISFDPDAISPPAPVVSLAPDGSHGDRQATILTAGGYSAYAYARVVECQALSDDTCALAAAPDAGVSLGQNSAGADGRLVIGLRLRRFVSGFDCARAPAACELRVVADENFDAISRLSLTFDSNIDPSAEPLISVAPATDLRHGDTVTVTAHNFLPNADLYLTQCLNDGSPCRGFIGASADGTGAATTTFVVARRVSGIDCVETGCELRTQDSNGTDVATASLLFDASIPPPPAPSLAASPTTGLVDLQALSVHAENLDNAYVQVQQCDAAGQICRGNQDGQANADGTYETTMAVRRILSGPNGRYDCATEAEGCILRLWSYSEESITLTTPLEFDPNGPLPQPPTARLVPASGLTDREPVRVLGSNFDPDEGLSIAECAGDPPDPVGYEATTCLALREFSVRSGPGGDLDHRVQVRRTLVTANGESHDCARERCTLAVYGDSTRLVMDLRFTKRGDPVTSAFPGQLPCVAWPTTDWQTGPLPAGVDASALDAIANESLVQRSSVDSILVVHGGRLVFERYREGKGPDTEMRSFSMAKSMTSSIIGMLIDEGRLDLDGPAPVPEWSDPDDPRHAISIRNLLNMSSGLHWTENYYDGTSDVIQMLAGSGSSDMAHFAADRDLASPPGTSWQYSTGDTMILAGIIAREVGTGPTLDAFLHARLFDPIGMGPMNLGFDGSGVWVGGAFANTTSRSFAKFGLLYLRGGVWDGQQLLASGWADYVRTPAPTTSGYGAQFWLGSPPGSFEAIGFLGQMIQIIPELDLVIVVNSTSGNDVDVDGIVNQFARAAPPGCATMTANDDSAKVKAGRRVHIRVLQNDVSDGSKVDRGTLRITREPSLGEVRIHDDLIHYRADREASGTDTLSYEVCNRNGDCDEATVTVAVSAR